MVVVVNFNMSKMPEESIVICTLHRDWNADNDAGLWAALISDMLQRVKSPIYFILDLRNAILDPRSILVIEHKAARGSSAFIHQPNLRGLIMVSKQPIIALAAWQMKTREFGFAPVSVHNDLEDALKTARCAM
jgi:hypothetical protein